MGGGGAGPGEGRGRGGGDVLLFVWWWNRRSARSEKKGFLTAKKVRGASNGREGKQRDGQRRGEKDSLVRQGGKGWKGKGGGNGRRKGGWHAKGGGGQAKEAKAVAREGWRGREGEDGKVRE